jgi:hypothetical protein
MAMLCLHKPNVQPDVPFLIHQKGRIQRAGGVLHRYHQIILAPVPDSQACVEASGTPLACLPPADRFAMVQHHPQHRPARPLLTMRRALLRRLHQALAMQMQLGHRVAQNIVVTLHQMFVEMLDSEAAVNVAIQPQHSFDLSHRGAPRRRCQPPIGQPSLACSVARQSSLAMAIAPTAEASFTDPKQFRRLYLPQLRPLGTA